MIWGVLAYLVIGLFMTGFVHCDDEKRADLDGFGFIFGVVSWPVWFLLGIGSWFGREYGG